MDTIEAKSILNVKILYLNDISLFTSEPLYQEPWDFLSHNLYFNHLSSDAHIVDFPDFTTTENLHVPEVLAVNYLGESISLFFKIQNDSMHTLSDAIQVKIELRSPKYSSILHEESLNSMNSFCSIDRIVSHEINDLGTHSILANIMYLFNSEKMHLQKTFSFDVIKPIDIKTKYVSPEYLEFTILESRIQNMTHQKLCLDGLSLRSLSKYEVKPLISHTNYTTEPPDCEIEPKETISYLFKISPLGNLFLSSKDMGKLDITWRNNIIQRGRLQTGNLDKPLKNSHFVRIYILEIPGVIYCYKTFEVKILIQNVSNCTLSLQICLQNFPLIFHWCGKSNFTLTDLITQGSEYIVLKAICFRPGHHTIGGLSFRDVNIHREIEFSILQNILVV